MKKLAFFGACLLLASGLVAGCGNKEEDAGPKPGEVVYKGATPTPEQASTASRPSNPFAGAPAMPGGGGKKMGPK